MGRLEDILRTSLPHRSPVPNPAPPSSSGQPGDSASVAELQQLAATLQHEISNPLAALLAEAQLLARETGMDPEHHRAVTRLVDLARRAAAAVRRLDELRGGSGIG